jgi:thioredoxin-dependent peroxiredoxin
MGGAETDSGGFVMLKENDLAPDFEVPTHDGSRVRLSDLRGQRVILFFYPRADTPGCTVEACEFRDLTPQIEEKGARVLGISPDSVAAVRKFREKFDFPFTLLADEDNAVAEAYGVWGEKSMFGKRYMGVDRTTFLIDAEGHVEKVFRKVKPEGHAKEVLSDL